MNQRRSLAEGILQAIDRFLIPPSLDPDERSRRLVIGFAIVVGTPVLYAFGIYHLHEGLLFKGLIETITATSFAINFFLAKFQRGIRISLRFNLALIGFVFLHALLLSGTMGYTVYWLYILPVVHFFLLGPVTGMIFNLT